RARANSPEPVLLLGLQLQARPEDAVRVRPHARNGPPAPAGAVPALDRQDLLVARSVTTPDGDRLPLEVGDEGEAVSGPHGLCTSVGERVRMEVETALVGARALVVLE